MIRSKPYRNQKLQLSFGLSILPFGVILLLSACSLLERQKEPEIVDRSFVSDEPCAAPCWYGLIPGEPFDSSIGDVLADLPFVDQNSIQVWENTGFLIFTTGTYIIYNCIEGDENPPCGNIFLADGIVQYIGHQLVFKLSLKTVIDKLGAPDYVIRTPYSPHGDNCEIDLDWLEQGIIARIVGQGKWCTDMGEGKALNPDMNITS